MNKLYEHHKIIVDSTQPFLRIDKYLSCKLPHISRTKIQHVLRQKRYIDVNQKPVKSNYIVKPQDKLSIRLDIPSNFYDISPENIPLCIIYEDSDIVVVNKPSGMVVHPASTHRNRTLVNALLYKFNELPSLSNEKYKAGLVHRIDKNTSGLLVIAKTESAMKHLAKQFSEHTIQRNYYALVWGEPKCNKGTIRINIIRNKANRRTYTVSKDERGKCAITHYEVIKNLHYVSLVKCSLETGRTHQIRVHLKYIGHTLFNDDIYGGNKVLKGKKTSKYKAFVENSFKMITGQALHAKSLGFIHPTKAQYVNFESELPKDFNKLIERWENYIAC